MCAMTKSSRFASSKQCAVGSSVAACKPLFISSKKLPEIEERMRFLKIEVVDDTALIETSLISNSKGKISNNRRQETIAMKKRPRKDWKIKKIKKGKAYSRAEMLALSLQNLHHQRNKWSQVYGSLTASVAAEYDALVAAAPACYRRPIFIHNFDGGAGAGATAMGETSPLKICVH